MNLFIDEVKFGKQIFSPKSSFKNQTDGAKFCMCLISFLTYTCTIFSDKAHANEADPMYIKHVYRHT